MTDFDIYCDGGVVGHNPSALAGTWAFCHVDKDGNHIEEQSGLVMPDESPTGLITNNLTEMIALVRAIERIDLGFTGTIYSDSQITLGRAFLGWKMDGIPERLEKCLRSAVSRLGTGFKWKLLDGHPTKAQLASGKGKRGNLVSVHNKWCDEECGRQAKAFLLEREC